MEQPWSPEDEQLARRFASRVVERGMAMPTVLFLESVRPLHFVGGQFLHFVSPMTGLFLPRLDLERLGYFLEHRGSVAFLVAEIERLERERQSAERQARAARRDAGGGSGGLRQWLRRRLHRRVHSDRSRPN